MILKQVNMLKLDELMSEEHQYHKFKSVFNFKVVKKELLSVGEQGILQEIWGFAIV